MIGVGAPMRSLAVPAAGITREGDGTMTARITTDRRRFTQRTVEVGLRQDGWDQILKGLQPREAAVTEGCGISGRQAAHGELMGAEG